MTRVPINLGIAVLFCLTSCLATRPVSPERSPYLNNWLLVHVNEMEGSNFVLKRNILIGMETGADAEHFVRVYYSQIGPGGSGFKYACAQGNVSLNARGKALFISTDPDSSGKELRLYMGAKSFWFEFDPLLGTLHERVELHLGLIKEGWPATDSWFNGCRLWSVDAKLNRTDIQRNGFAQVSILGIPDLSSMMASGQGGDLAWLHLRSGLEVGGMLMYREGGSWIPLAATGKLNEAMKSPVIVLENWDSNIGSQSYPVGFMMSNGMNISAVVKDQELRLGAKSFWMGAVEAFKSEQSLDALPGNMVIFRPLR
jgi:hypothetical protein